MKGQVKLGKRKLGFFINLENGVVFISPRKSEHKFRIYDGWGMNQELVEELNENGIIQIRIVVDKGKKILIASPKTWLEKGIRHTSKGFEPQIILPEEKLRFFSSSDLGDFFLMYCIFISSTFFCE